MSQWKLGEEKGGQKVQQHLYCYSNHHHSQAIMRGHLLD
jgi:hypothetical protein